MRRRAPAAVGLAVVMIVVASTTADAWTLSGHETINSLTQGQGLATVQKSDGTSYRFYDGSFSVPADKSAAGWNHVGDPDSSHGLIFQPYQAASSSTAAKLFHVIAEDGTGTDFVHHDFAGEEYNNSFVAVSPDHQWMVSGEWDHMTRLLVMPTPLLNPSATDPAADLPVVAQIQLDAIVTDVQGCSFDSATELVCSSDDPIAENGFVPKFIFRVELPHALDGTTLAGHVVAIGQVPLQSSCSITAPGSWPDDFEVEGVDVDPGTGELRVEVIPPGACGVTGDVYVYAADPAEPPTTPSTSVPSEPSGDASVQGATATNVVATPVAAVPTFTG